MASGDLVYVMTVEGDLTNAEKTALGSVINRLWPGLLTEVDSATFNVQASNGNVRAVISGERTSAPSAVPGGVFIRRKLP